MAIGQCLAPLALVVASMASSARLNSFKKLAGDKQTPSVVSIAWASSIAASESRPFSESGRSSVISEACTSRRVASWWRNQDWTASRSSSEGDAAAGLDSSVAAVALRHSAITCNLSFKKAARQTCRWILPLVVLAMLPNWIKTTACTSISCFFCYC